MRIRNEEFLHRVVVRHFLHLAALAAAALRVVVGHFLALDEAVARKRDDHAAVRNQVALVEVRIAEDVDRRAAFVAVLLADFLQFVADDRVDAFRTGQDVEEVDDVVHRRVVVVAHAFLFEPRQAAQIHREDVFNLHLREEIGAVSRRPRPNSMPSG